MAKQPGSTLITSPHTKALGALLVQGIPTNLPDDVARYWLDNHRDELHRKLDDLLRGSDTTSWIDQIVQFERGAHEAFFGEIFGFRLELLRLKLEEYGRERVEAWQKLGLMIHVLPDATFRPEWRKYPGWDVVPQGWYWRALNARKLLCKDPKDANRFDLSTNTLPGKVILSDSRSLPLYKRGRQMFEYDSDFMGEILAMLRATKRIQDFEPGPKGSRFGLCTFNWQSEIRPAVAAKIGLPVEQVRLPTVLEDNVITQLYGGSRASEFTNRTLTMYEDSFADGYGYSLIGGATDRWGRMIVDRISSYQSRDDVAFRPIAVL